MRKSTKLRNTHIKPGELVPEHIRVEVYKEAMKVIKKGEPVHGITFFSLCLLLPSILWNLLYYIDDAPNGKPWNIWDTPNMFPELTEQRVNQITDIARETGGEHIRKRNIKRLSMLREMIAELTKEDVLQLKEKENNGK